MKFRLKGAYLLIAAGICLLAASCAPQSYNYRKPAYKKSRKCNCPSFSQNTTPSHPATFGGLMKSGRY